MKDYEVTYIDSHGDKQDYVVTSTDVRTAMNNMFELQCHIASALCAVHQNQCLRTNVQNTNRDGSNCRL